MEWNAKLYIVIIIYIIAIILFLLAIYWEAMDYCRIKKRPCLSDIKSKKDRIKETRFHARFNYENNPVWRNVYIGSFISAAAISAILYYCGYDWPTKNILFPLLILIIIFFVFYIIYNFKQFHLYRDMCSKIDQNITIL
jgi:hypothetical protein